MTLNVIIWVSLGVFTITNGAGFLYSMAVLHTSWFKKFRIQDKAYGKAIFKKRLPLYLLNVLLVLGLTASGLYFIGDQFDTSIPTVWVFLAQLIFIFLIDDAWFYFAHRWMHQNTWALKNIHSIHHRATTPFPLEYLYVHPLEWMLGMVGLVIGIGLIFIVMPANIYVFWTVAFLRNLHELQIHSDLKIPVLSWFPLISGTENHDLHHAKLNGNYASTFSIWDKIMKTEFKDEK